RTRTIKETPALQAAIAEPTRRTGPTSRADAEAVRPVQKTTNILIAFQRIGLARTFSLPVPELTRSTDIQLNERLRLRDRVDTLASSNRTLPNVRVHSSKAVR